MKAKIRSGAVGWMSDNRVVNAAFWLGVITSDQSRWTCGIYSTDGTVRFASCMMCNMASSGDLALFEHSEALSSL